MSAQLSAKFMFGLLDYETYNLFIDDDCVGQVTINHMDRTAHLNMWDPTHPAELHPPDARYRQWCTWLAHHTKG